MKHKLLKFLKLFFLLTFFTILFVATKATVHQVNVSDFAFSPATINNVMVGDTVRWLWVNGFHTTTSGSIPAGASSWDHPMNSTSTAFDYVVTETGSYNYVCTPHSVSMTGTFITNISTATNHTLSSSKDISIYPNPFKNSFHIDVDIKAVEFTKVVIGDVLGKKIAEFSITNKITKIDEDNYPDLARLPEGMYFLTLTGSGKDKYTIRIIKSQK